MTFSANIEAKVISHYFKSQWENTVNHRPFIQALMKRGNVEKGIAGKTLTWNARVARYAMTDYGVGEAINVSEKRQTIQATLPWSFQTMTDAITHEEMQMANGPEAMQKRQAEICKNLYSDFEGKLNYGVLNTDGPATTGSPIYGLPSFLTFTTAGTLIEGVANDSYAGHSTVLSSLANVDNADADAWTPKCVDATASDWTGATDTFAVHGVKAISYLETLLTYGAKAGEAPDLVICNRSDFNKLKELIIAVQAIQFTSAPGNAPQGLGIPGGIVIGGVEVLFDTDCPTGVAYMVNSRQAWLEILPASPVASSGPSMPGKGGDGSDLFAVRTQEDIRTNGIGVRATWGGQFRFNPKFHGKIKTA
jgi:hypothetical protein